MGKLASPGASLGRKLLSTGRRTGLIDFIERPVNELKLSDMP
jgi:hypothetical protein